VQQELQGQVQLERQMKMPQELRVEVQPLSRMGILESCSQGTFQTQNRRCPERRHTLSHPKFWR
jgi:hypothetical protein